MSHHHPSRRAWLKSTAALSFAAAAAFPPVRERRTDDGSVVDLGRCRQLFLDDEIVQEIKGLTRNMHQPLKRGAVIKPDQPWETALQTRSAPAWDAEQRIFKLWLITSTNVPDPNVAGATVGGTTYAESQDGIHWTKPHLRQWMVAGSVENNFIAVNGKHSWPDNGIENVVRDPDDSDPRRRYKGFYGVHGRRPMVSPNGTSWTLLDAAVLPSSDESNLSYDSVNKTFIASLKTGGPFGRSHAIWTSRDFAVWEDLSSLFHADDLDQRLAKENIAGRFADDQLQQPIYNDPADYNADIYNLGLFRYEGTYIGMPAVYHATGKLPGGNTDGFHLIQLACSRDLRTWNRLGDRRPFLGPSRVAADGWDLTQLLPPSAPVVCDNELWFYYTGIKYREKPAQADDRTGAVCLAVLRRDGFVSLAATHDPGSVTTKPFTWPDGSLHLNVDATQGEVRVSMLDSTGRTTAQSRPLRGDRLAGQVQFDKRAAVGARVSLKFTLQDCNLYSFWFAPS